METNGAKAQYEGQGVENYVLKSGTNAVPRRGVRILPQHRPGRARLLPGHHAHRSPERIRRARRRPHQEEQSLLLRQLRWLPIPLGIHSHPAVDPDHRRARPAISARFPARHLRSRDRRPARAPSAPARRSPATSFRPTGSPSLAIAGVLSSRSDQLEHPEQLPGQPADPGEHLEYDREDRCQPVRQAPLSSASSPTGTTPPISPAASTRPDAGVLPEPYTQGRIVEEDVKMAQIHDTYTIKPTLLNQFSYSFNRIWIPLQNPTVAGLYPQKAGIKGLPPSEVSQAFPDINFTGTNSPGGWQGTNAHFFNEAANTFTAQDNLMWVKGRHSLVFGFQFQALQDNENFAVDRHAGSFNCANNETGIQSDRIAGRHHRQCLRQLPAGRREQQRHQPERHRRDRRPLQGLRRLCPGRLEGQLASDAEPRPALGPLGTVLRSEQPDVVLQPEPGQSGRRGPSRARSSLPATAPTVATAGLPSTLTTRTSARAWERRTVSTTRPCCGRLRDHVRARGWRRRAQQLAPGTQPARFQRHQQRNQPRQQRSGILLG